MAKHDTGYRRLIAHYEDCLERHGDTHLGVDWPDSDDAKTRYRVMLDVIREPADQPVSLLDFGCGAAHLLDFIQANRMVSLNYQGLDASPKFISLCRQKFPGVPFHQKDVLAEPLAIEPVDYVVLNGVLTEKMEMTTEEMCSYMEALIGAIWPLARTGLAFNVMSTQVDWQRDDLFHFSFDAMAQFISRNLSRHFLFRQDYGLFDYTVYVYREPTARP